jgi:hypothetical protein
MKTSSWFDAFALLVIALMSFATGASTDPGRVDAAHAFAIGQR